MREEAPVYYDEKYDFLWLTRHETWHVPTRFTRLIPRRVEPTSPSVRSPEPPTPKSIIFMDPPDHRAMRSLLNKVFHARRSQSQSKR